MGGTRRSAMQLTRCVDEGQGTMMVEGGRRPALWSEVMAEAWREALSDAEVRELLEMRDWRSWLSIAVDWGTIGVALALVARWPNPLTVVVALFVIGGRQLGLAVLMHEAAHRTLFRERRWNDLVGNWLCAYPVWSDLYPYRPYHLQHHAKTWTEHDPDLPLAAPFPVTRASMRRKIWRDLSGRTGWKRSGGSSSRTACCSRCSRSPGTRRSISSGSGPGSRPTASRCGCARSRSTAWCPTPPTRCATRARRSRAGGSGCSSRRIASIITSSTTS